MGLGCAMDWSQCRLIEVIPGKLSGAPVVKGTRLRAETIVSNYEAGSSVEEIAANYPSVSIAEIEELLAYAGVRKAFAAA